MSFLEKYGPWAVITGASDGTGEIFARQLAAKGLNLVLIARRVAPLTALAAQLEQEFGISTRTASIDLYEPGAGKQVFAAAEGLEVGLYVSNAGADSNNARFLEAPSLAWQQLINRNVVVLTETVYAFAKAMQRRGKGGIILMSSGAALGGAPGVAVYSATKAFDLNLAELLWAELGNDGIDVLAGVCPAMDTPSIQNYLAKKNLTIPGLVDPAVVVTALLAGLGDGPCQVFGWGPGADEAKTVEHARRARVAQMIEATKMFSGDKR